MAMPPAKSPAELLAPGRALTLAGVADGAEGWSSPISRARSRRGRTRRRPASWWSAATGRAWRSLRARSRSSRPRSAVDEFPAWDCLPYDRVSPHAGVVAQRMTTLSRLARLKGRDRPGVVLTTVNAALQRVPAKDVIATQSLSAAPGNVLAMDGVTALAGAQRL